MSFDPEHFRRRFPGRPLPDLHFHSARRRWELHRRLVERFGLGAEAEQDPTASAVWLAFDRAALLDVPDAAAGGFDPAAALEAAGISPAGPVYVDWYLGDQARIDGGELCRSFPGIWKSGADDLAVFDDACSAALYVARGGSALAARADPAGDDIPAARG